MSTTFQASCVEVAVKRGWRRRLLVLAVDESAIVLALISGGFALLILLGTQILAWQWLLALGAVGLGLAVFGVRRRLADAYQVAQMMDRRLSLNDSLSTAWFLRTHAATKSEQAAYQLERAEELARAADPAAAFPFQRRRSWIIAAPLCTAALALFSARYLITRELSLQHTFLPFAITQVFEYVRHGGATPERKSQDAAARQGNTFPPGLLGQDPENQTQTAKAEQEKKASRQSGGGPAGEKVSKAQGQNAEQTKDSDGQDSDDERGSEKRSGAGDESRNGSNPQAADGGKQDAAGPQESNHLIDRMRDALSSVMAKIKPSGDRQNSQSASQKNAEGQKGADQSGTKDQSGEGQKDAGKEQSAQEQSSGEQQGQGEAKAQASQGKDSAQASEKMGSDAQSGVGHSDGDKELKAAEQAQAMGKLAEIIGKRSASLTGDMQIEPSGKQRLQTGYTRELGRHSDQGGEINRDEVPVEDQEYVREYMELVRRQPEKKAISSTTGQR